MATKKAGRKERRRYEAEATTRTRNYEGWPAQARHDSTLLKRKEEMWQMKPIYNQSEPRVKQGL